MANSKPAAEKTADKTAAAAAEQPPEQQVERVDVRVVSSSYTYGRARLGRGSIIRGMPRAAFEETKTRLPPELEEITSDEGAAAPSVDAEQIRAQGVAADAAEAERRSSVTG